MPGITSNILGTLDEAVNSVASNIHSYTKHPGDFTRSRKLPAAEAIKVTLNMQGNTLNAELLEAFPDLDARVTASAYVQAKGKLCPEVFEDVFHTFNATMEDPRTMNGYRIFAVDGSAFNVPYDKDSAYVMESTLGRPKKDGSEQKPFSQFQANMLYDIMNRTYEDCIIQPRSVMDERDAAIQMLKRLDCGKHIVIMDRGYDGFNMLETLNRIDGCYYVIRTKAGSGGIKEIAALPDKECDREFTFDITTSRTFYNNYHNEIPNLKHIHHPKHPYKADKSRKTKDQRWDFGDRCKVRVRVVKFRINDPDTGKDEWEVLFTNLSCFEFPASRMKELYHMRWDIETSFRELKYALGAVQFHSKKDDFVQMELFAHLTMFNAVSRCIACVHVSQGKDNKHQYAIDFKMACLVTRRFYRSWCTDPPDKIFIELGAFTHPIREGRSDKRNMKPKGAIYFLYRVA